MIYESQKRASAKWDKENMMIVGAKVRREFAAEFKDACKAAGTSPNAVIKKAMADFIKSHRADGSGIIQAEMPATDRRTYHAHYNNGTLCRASRSPNISAL